MKNQADWSFFILRSSFFIVRYPLTPDPTPRPRVPGRGEKGASRHAGLGGGVGVDLLQRLAGCPSYRLLLVLKSLDESRYRRVCGRADLAQGVGGGSAQVRLPVLQGDDQG